MPIVKSIRTVQKNIKQKAHLPAVHCLCLVCTLPERFCTYTNIFFHVHLLKTVVTIIYTLSSPRRSLLYIVFVCLLYIVLKQVIFYSLIC